MDAGCIAQFCIIRCFVLTAQMTLALMAVERYIFNCHSIHYLRMIDTCNVHVGTGFIWLVSLAVSLHGGIVVSLHAGGFLQPTSGFLCDDITTMSEHFTLSHREFILLIVPPTVITNVCILSVCYCYGGMYCTALRVSMTLKRSNHRANRTVGFYFLMFLPQLLLALLFFILMMSEKKKASSCVKITALVTPLLLIIPSLVQAAFHLIRTPQIRQLIFPTRIEEEEVFHGIENHKQAERENTSASPA
ncbi:hypothetical protein KUCAC02_000983 [Chaenocephalus aceratus]|uniref:Uncharacterized protein n=1 Tax=Chaenocephalus aceratus TaxID=36190 RepID=A0ACB9XWB0_CHAAC|nr:hypothetical protein KUCAC02_000983 [Chaenocephalus aceratus]